MNEALHPHGANLRKGRVSERGRVYLVTFVVRERRPIFQDFGMGRLLGVGADRVRDLLRRAVADAKIADTVRSYGEV